MVLWLAKWVTVPYSMLRIAAVQPAALANQSEAHPLAVLAEKHLNVKIRVNGQVDSDSCLRLIGDDDVPDEPESIKGIVCLSRQIRNAQHHGLIHAGY